MKKKTHGGKRKGSGRPKGEPTTTIRIPVSKISEVKKFIVGGGAGVPQKVDVNGKVIKG